MTNGESGLQDLLSSTCALFRKPNCGKELWRLCSNDY
jgi:hypothetical protein